MLGDIMTAQAQAPEQAETQGRARAQARAPEQAETQGRTRAQAHDTGAAARPRRGNAGSVRLSQRDIDGLLLCGEHYGVPYDLLADALRVHSKRLEKILARWRHAGYVATGRLGPGPGWCWLTRDGMAATGLGFPAGRPALARLAHIRAVLAARLWLAAGQVWAIEVELTPKPVARTTGIMAGLLSPMRYATVVYLTAPAARPVVLRAAASLPPGEQARVAVRDLPTAAFTPEPSASWRGATKAPRRRAGDTR